MTIKSSGTISLSDINVELGRASNAPINLDETAVRNLAGKPTGLISLNDFYGKSAYIAGSKLIAGLVAGVVGYGSVWAGPMGSLTPTNINGVPITDIYFDGTTTWLLMPYGDRLVGSRVTVKNSVGVLIADVLLPILSGDGTDGKVSWSGYYWSGNVFGLVNGGTYYFDSY